MCRSIGYIYFFCRFSHQSGPANIVRSRLFAAHYPLRLGPVRWQYPRPVHPAVAPVATARRILLSTEDPCPPSCGSQSAPHPRGRRRGLPRARRRGLHRVTPRVLAHRGNPGNTRLGNPHGSIPLERIPASTRRATRPGNTRRARQARVSHRARWSRARRRGWPWRWTRQGAQARGAWARATAPPTRSCSSTTPTRRPRRGAPPTYSPRPPRTHSARSELRFSSQFF